MSTLKDDFVDHYALLGVEAGCSDSKVLSRAYKQLALKWHPDKNVGNIEEASRQFDLVRKAFDTLSDPERREDYDKVHRARAAAAERHERLTGKRKRMKEELLQREREAAEIASASLKTRKRATGPERKKQTISDLRKAGETQRRAMDVARAARRGTASTDTTGAAQRPSAAESGEEVQTRHIASIKWKRKHGPRHSAESLRALLTGKCSCTVENVLLGRKGNRAIVEFLASDAVVQKMVERSENWGLTISLRQSKNEERQKEMSSAVFTKSTPELQSTSASSLMPNFEKAEADILSRLLSQTQGR